VDGVDYHFVGHERFEKEEDFMEITDYNHNKYGTSFEAVRDVMNGGRLCLMNVHYSAAQKIERLRPRWCHFIFVTVSGGKGALRERLQNRGSESAESLEKRLQSAAEEFDFAEENGDFFDCILPNDGDVDSSVEALAKVLASWYPQFECRRRRDRAECAETLSRFTFPRLARTQCTGTLALFLNFGVAWFLLLDIAGSEFHPSWSATV